MKKSFSLPRGTADILPDDIVRWRGAEESARSLLNCYGYKEVRTPVFEETELFARSVGETSDIVQKQMLNLASQAASTEGMLDAGSLSLRPEGTASIVRSYIQNRFDLKEQLSKLFYIGPMFRGERPQKGRLRQFHQIGVEAIGPNSASPYLDAEVISLSVSMLKSFGLKDFTLKLNTLGTLEDKEGFSLMLRDRIAERVENFCPDCQSRYERNVFRILDCKNSGCRKAVKDLNLTHDYLSEKSRVYFESVKSALKSLAVSYIEDLYLVRGLDYYTHTVFELSCPGLGSQDAVGAGGRYDNLVEQLGGPSVDAVGFALGLERILLATEGKRDYDLPALDVFFVALGDRSFSRAFELLQVIRHNGISADMRFSGGSLKSQMRQADKSGCRYVAIIGEDELSGNSLILKNMKEGTQEELSLDNITIMIKILRG